MKILLGLDASSMAPRLIESAGLLAAKLGAPFALIRAVEPLFALEAIPVSRPQILTDMLKAADHDLQTLAAHAPTASAIPCAAKLGAAWSVVCEEAKETGADILCVGAHGYSPTQRMLGTVAARVAGHAPCSVLLLRPSQPSFENIVVGLDGSRSQAEILAQALMFADLFDTQITLVSAVPFPVVPRDDRTVDEIAEQRLELTKVELEKVCDGIATTLKVSTVVALGAPWEVLCDVASTQKAQLLVIGAHGHRRLDALLGTTTIKVADHAPCSVFIVREQK